MRDEGIANSQACHKRRHREHPLMSVPALSMLGNRDRITSSCLILSTRTEVLNHFLGNVP